jgi:hypothetical protein
MHSSISVKPKSKVVLGVAWSAIATLGGGEGAQALRMEFQSREKEKTRSFNLSLASLGHKLEDLSLGQEDLEFNNQDNGQYDNQGYGQYDNQGYYNQSDNYEYQGYDANQEDHNVQGAPGNIMGNCSMQ